MFIAQLEINEVAASISNNANAYPSHPCLRLLHLAEFIIQQNAKVEPVNAVTNPHPISVVPFLHHIAPSIPTPKLRLRIHVAPADVLLAHLLQCARLLVRLRTCSLRSRWLLRLAREALIKRSLLFGTHLFSVRPRSHCWRE